MRYLGGNLDGVLRDYAIFESEALVKNPEALTHEHACLVPCAGVTAWTSLAQDDHKKVSDIKKALMEGTGGVSLFCLLICLAADITPIITSSSDDKLFALKQLASPGKEIHAINYRRTPDWAEEVLKITDRQGVDVLVNNAGATTMNQSFKALKQFGTISLVGVLGGTPDVTPDVTTQILLKGAHVQ